MTPLKARPGIMDITPYVGGESALDDFERVIKLASNEGALGPSPQAVAAYEGVGSGLHRYPDGACGALRRALGDIHQLDPSRIVCGAGSDELIGLICRAYAGPGDEVLHTQYGFLMYPIAARTAGATPVAAPETKLTADIDKLVERITSKTRILFLANPNNPTGTYLKAGQLARLRRDMPAAVLLVIDAAYAEFVEDADYDPGTGLVEGGDNVVMTRTFSKIHGLGGARLGWAYCPAAIADVLNRVRNPFNVSGPALAAGLAALKDRAFTDKARRHNRIWREWTAEKLAALGLDITPSAGNFLLVGFPAPAAGDNRQRGADAADAYLKGRGIIVRRMAGYGLPDCLRISIGREDEMRAVAGALKEFMD